MRALAHLNKYLWHYKGQIILGLLFIVLTNLFAIYAPRLIREAFDLISESIHTYQSGNVADYNINLPFSVRWIFDTFGFSTAIYKDINSMSSLTKAITSLSILLGVLYLLAAILKGIFLFFTRQTIIVMSRHIEFDLKNEIFDHYQKLSLAFYRRNNTGDLMNRISEDVNQVRMYLGPAIMYTLNLLVLSILAITAMVSVNLELTLYVLIPLPILSVSIYYVSTLINKRSEKVQRQQSYLSTLVQETFSGIRVLKAFNRQKSTMANFARECNVYKVDTLSLVKVDALFMPAILLLIGLSTIITIYIGGLKAIAGEITIGNIAEFVIYVNLLTWPFASIGWVTSLVQRAAASQKRINEFLHTEPEIKNTKTEPDTIAGKIEFDHVSFTYPDSGIKALVDVNFTINPGETLAIIGRTGSGKSTIANLICRNFDVTKGQLRIDGKAIQDINLNSLRSNIGYVPQDVFLFSETIRNNIAFGVDSEEDLNERIVAATENAFVKHNIDAFPKQFETMLGERGINLSGGQKQRVSIARAIIGEPQILIFDDCLSAVDTETEEIILNNLKKIMTGKTTVLISHRVSTVKLADKIIVLERGQIIETGSHADLLDKNGIYSELHRKQLSEERKTEVE